jgi:ubiquitin fusion degradation protein 1
MDVDETDDSGACLASHYYTHCGIREFSAPPGSIGVPDKVIQSLLARRNTWVSVPEGSDESEGLSAHLPVLGGLSVKYVTMPKVTYACLQPLRNAFQAVSEVKDCLEQNLRTHSSLSVGDLVTIWHRGVPHQLRVKKRRPSDFGSLLQTDVEVDLDASEEYLRSSATAKATSGAPATPAAAKDARSKAVAIPMAVDTPDPFPRMGGAGTVLGRATVFARDAASTSASAPEKQNEKEKEKEAAVQVPDEPSSSESGVVSCRLRLPSGATLNRRFRRSDAIAAVFEIVAKALEVRRSAVCLSTSFPTRNIEYSPEVGDGLTLEQAGLTSNSVLMVSVR